MGGGWWDVKWVFELGVRIVVSLIGMMNCVFLLCVKKGVILCVLI